MVCCRCIGRHARGAYRHDHKFLDEILAGHGEAEVNDGTKGSGDRLVLGKLTLDPGANDLVNPALIQLNVAENQSPLAYRV